MSNIKYPQLNSQAKWMKVSRLSVGMAIAVPKNEVLASHAQGGRFVENLPKLEKETDIFWDEIVSIEHVGRERVYDIEVEGSHNFVGNGIFAHNTYLNGNVGIGTTTPGTLLDVNGSGNFDSLYVQATSTVSSLIATSTLEVRGAGGVSSPALWVGDGMVGIGTTAPSELLAMASDAGSGGDVTFKIGQLYDNDGYTRLATYQDAGGFVLSANSEMTTNIGATASNATLDYSSRDGLALRTFVGQGTATFAIDQYGWGSGARTPTTQFIVKDGNVGIGTTAPGAQLDLSTDSARKLTTTTWSTGSDSRIKTQVESISDALDIINRVRPVKFHYTPEFLAAHPSAKDTDYYNFIAQEYQEVFPDSVTEIDGLLYLNSSNMIPYAIAGVKALDQTTSPLRYGILVASEFSTSTPFMIVDATGNIGIGTSTPSHKLEVAGDVAAMGFVNLSTREAKKDINYLNAGDESDVLAKIKSTSVATYSYNNDQCPIINITDPNNPNTSELPEKILGSFGLSSGISGRCTTRLGLIAEQAPAEVLSFDGKGVDLYKMTSFLWAGVKAQQTEIDQIKIDLAQLRVDIGQVNPISPIGLINPVAQSLQNAFSVAKSYISGLAEQMAGWMNGVLAQETVLEIVNENADNKTYKTYSLQSSRDEVIASGSATLVKLDADPQTGLAPVGVRVRFDESFVSIISETESIKVVLTPTTRLNGGLYVHAKSRFGFEVREINAQDEGGMFDWVVIARKRGVDANTPSAPSSPVSPVISPTPAEEISPTETTPTSAAAESGQAATSIPVSAAEPISEPVIIEPISPIGPINPIEQSQVEPAPQIEPVQVEPAPAQEPVTPPAIESAPIENATEPASV